MIMTIIINIVNISIIIINFSIISLINYHELLSRQLPYVGKNITCIRSLIGYLHILAIHVHRRRIVSLSSEPSSGEPPRRAIIDDARIWQSCLQTVAVT